MRIKAKMGSRFVRIKAKRRSLFVLILSTYALTRNFPKVEQYRLVDQLTRAAVSVPSNIAEGFGRTTNKDFAHFVAQARGSLFEVETQLIIANELGFIDDITIDIEGIAELSKVLNGLIRSLKRD